MTNFTKLLIISGMIGLHHFDAAAQCTASITGNSCITSTLTAHYTGNPQTIEWYLNGVLQQVRAKRNPNSTVAAGGGTTSASSLSGPQDMAVDNNGNLYIVDGNNYRVQKWAPGASEGTTVAGGNGKGSNLNQFFSPQGIAVDNNGNVYVCDALMQRVTKWAPGATVGVVVAGGNGTGAAANQLNGPQNIFLDANGALLIADRWNNRVQKWAAGATTGVTVAGGNGSGSGANQLTEPLDVVADQAGNVYVVDYFNYRVQKWAPGATTGTTVAGGNGKGTAANQFAFTTALSITNDGTLFIRDQDNYRVQQWNPGAVAGITVAGGNGTGGSTLNKIGPGFGLCVDQGKNVFVPELFENVVKKFSPAAKVDSLLTTNTPGDYKIKVKGGGCTAASAVFWVGAVPVKPARLIGPTSVVAQQDSVLFRVDKLKNETYTWTVPADATIIAGQGNSSMLVKWGMTDGYVAVVASSVCGTAPTKQKYVITSFPIVADQNTALTISPNPVISKATVTFSASKAASYVLTVTDITGRVLITQKGLMNTGTNRINVDVAQLRSGNYFINIKDDKQQSLKAGFLKK